MEPVTGAVRGICRCLIEEDGASASEYAVLTAVVVVAVAAAVSTFELNVFFGIKEKVLACVNGTNGC
jgi:Flp pilus assembly pilin Flp